MKRLSNVTVDGLYMLKAVAEGETDFEKVFKDAIDEAAFRRRMTKWSKRAGVSVPTMSQYYRNCRYSMTLYNANLLLKACGLRLTIEVDE